MLVFDWVFEIYNTKFNHLSNLVILFREIRKCRSSCLLNSFWSNRSKISHFCLVYYLSEYRDKQKCWREKSCLGQKIYFNLWGLWDCIDLFIVHSDAWRSNTDGIQWLHGKRFSRYHKLEYIFELFCTVNCKLPSYYKRTDEYFATQGQPSFS